MTPRSLHGLAVVGGTASGVAVVVPDRVLGASRSPGSPEEAARALAALDEVADQLERWAESARADGRAEEAEILEASRLIALDPVLREQIAVRARQVAAEASVRETIEVHAEALDSAGSARGSDVRELGNRVLRLLTETDMVPLPAAPTVVLARDLGPADVAELRLRNRHLLGLALARGAATSHVGIMARALGVPLVVGLGEELLADTDGEMVFLDGTQGTLVVSPDAQLRRRGNREARRREKMSRWLEAGRGEPAVTRDGARIELLCNASTPLEVRDGLAAGADGVGLVRTELAFLDASTWPSERAHERELRPILEQLRDRVATVRTLDFGGDKTPPFLEHGCERGLALSLAAPAAFEGQLRAILRASHGSRLRILLPFVRGAGEFEAAEQHVRAAVEDVGWAGSPPPLGAMIETPEAVDQVVELAAGAGFLSLGTNDLVQLALDLKRDSPLVSVEVAAAPPVLELVRRTVAGARGQGIAVGVCGEAAGKPSLAVLLLGLGVEELSVSPVKLDLIRWAVRAISLEEAEAAAEAALAAGSAREALEIGRTLLRAGESEVNLDDIDERLSGLV